MSKKMCPYCYNNYKISELWVRCNKCNELFNLKQLKFKNKVEIFINKTPTIDLCLKCNAKLKHNDYYFCCSVCKNYLPKKIIENENKIISLIGPRGSGKTTHLALLLDYIEENIKIDSEVSFRTLMLSAKKEYNDIIENIQDMLIEKKQNVTPTAPKVHADPNCIAGIPLIYSYNRNEENNILFFYDGAGEDFENYSALQDYAYLTNADGIIFMLDIFSDRRNRKNTKDTLLNLIDFLEENKAIKNIPIAFVVGKFDLHFSQGDKIDISLPRWDGNNDLEIMKEIDDLHRKILISFKDNKISNTGNIVQIIQKNFTNYKFIPISNFGYNPEKLGINDLDSSFNIEYPLVYLLNTIFKDLEYEK